jgi:hypothetical protein
MSFEGAPPGTLGAEAPIGRRRSVIDCSASGDRVWNTARSGCGSTMVP